MNSSQSLRGGVLGFWLPSLAATGWIKTSKNSETFKNSENNQEWTYTSFWHMCQSSMMKWHLYCSVPKNKISDVKNIFWNLILITDFLFPQSTDNVILLLNLARTLKACICYSPVFQNLSTWFTICFKNLYSTRTR